MRSLFSKSEKYERANQVLVTQHGVIDDKGEVKERETILRARATCCRANLKIPFVKLTKQALNFDPGDRVVHPRSLAKKFL